MDPYVVLGARKSWTLDEIEARFRELLRECHPDRHANDGPEATALAEEQTRRLTEAMAVIRRDHPRRAMPSGVSGVSGVHASAEAAAGWATGEDGGDFGISFGWPTASDPADLITRPCPLCGVTFDDADLLAIHVKSVHDLDPTRPAKSAKRRRGRRHRHRSRSSRVTEWIALAAVVALVITFLVARMSMTGTTKAIFEPLMLVTIAAVGALTGWLFVKR
jgi:curved DNA-binding protein CbpA